MTASTGAVTRLLPAVREGRAGLDELLPYVYEELRAVARAQLGRGAATVSMQPTLVVHEAYLKLARAGAVQARDRSHFMAIAATAMRQVVVDHARAKLSQKRGGGWQQVTLSAATDAVVVQPESVIALDAALARLDPRQRTIVECRFFAGMEEEEIAAALGVSARTVRREWVKARAWLYAELYAGEGSE